MLIKTSVLGKFDKYVIDHINALLRRPTHYNKHLSKAQKNRIKAEMKRRILHPTKTRPTNAPDLTLEQEEVVQFHRSGFCVNESPRPDDDDDDDSLGYNDDRRREEVEDDDESGYNEDGDYYQDEDTDEETDEEEGGLENINKYYIKSHPNRYVRFIQHFIQVQRRIELINDEYPKLHLKSRHFLPLPKLGTRKSVMIDKKMLYFILKHAEGLGWRVPDGLLNARFLRDGMLKGRNICVSAQYGDWYGPIREVVFNTNNFIRGSGKLMKVDGVFMTSDGLAANLHYLSPLPNENDNIISIENLGLR